MIDLIIGLACLLYGAGVLVYRFYFGEIETRMLVSGLISLLGGCYIIIPRFLAYVKKALPSKPFKKREKKEMEFDLSDKDLADFQALSYLKDRAAELKSDEAMKLVVQLNTLLFSGVLEKEEEKKDEK